MVDTDEMIAASAELLALAEKLDDTTAKVRAKVLADYLFQRAHAGEPETFCEWDKVIAEAKVRLRERIHELSRMR